MGSFGCMCHDKYLDYKIHLHGYAARYAKNRVWGENQNIIMDKENPGPDKDGIILSFSSNQLYAIQRWVWQWADEAWLIGPEELVEDWQGKLRKVSLMNQNCHR